MGHSGQATGLDLWDDEDGFFYDVLHLPDGTRFPLKVRSMVGLIPLFAVETLEPEMLDGCRASSAGWSGSSSNRPDLIDNVACMRTPGRGERRLLSIVDGRSAAARPAVHAGRKGVSLAVRHPRALALSPRPAVYAVE